MTAVGLSSGQGVLDSTAVPNCVVFSLINSRLRRIGKSPIGYGGVEMIS